MSVLGQFQLTNFSLYMSIYFSSYCKTGNLHIPDTAFTLLSTGYFNISIKLLECPGMQLSYLKEFDPLESSFQIYRVEWGQYLLSLGELFPRTESRLSEYSTKCPRIMRLFSGLVGSNLG